MKNSSHNQNTDGRGGRNCSLRLTNVLGLTLCPGDGGAAIFFSLETKMAWDEIKLQ